ncbi:unnamed protein product [Adineta steineri]|uniref:Uncharacterized protein n=1 Tax=Adineta steineri TaxID=433720 RepID=A0A815XE41_9BILA|nr:unnamed protein product [Adineta steineri]CAF1663160.1 unnamed protein product [Adineta steineri]
MTCTNGCQLNDKRRSFTNVIELVKNNVKDEIYSTVKRYLNLINEYTNCSSDLLPCDILLNDSIYQRLQIKKITILLHTDGAPVTKTGGKSLWPVQATIAERLPPVRDYVNATMIFAV